MQVTSVNRLLFFFFNDTATTEIYTLSPTRRSSDLVPDIRASLARLKARGVRLIDEEPRIGAGNCLVAFIHPSRSEEHTSELQSRQYLVCRLLLEKKKTKYTHVTHTNKLHTNDMAS